MANVAKGPVLETVSLTKVYGRQNEAKTFALRGVTFAVSRGDFVAIVGPSGSGKSTLLNLIGALDRPTSGKVVITGKDISKLESSELAAIRNTKIGFVFQSFNLISRMTAVENVEVPLLLWRMSPSERRRIALSLLDGLGIRDKANNRPEQLSGGEQQRVAIARALATNPEIILADEPTGNLDTKNAENVMDLLQNLNRKRGKTLIIITHSAEVASRANHVIYLRDGRIERMEAA
ncbi:MAG: ABC transporter ATP-binding protein [Nitrososphaerota archaeon]|nr:ABC transporter ATP-binding protein [Nitrososphaerota archaeon]